MFENLRLPVIAGPMFIASGPALVIAQCNSGIIGALPALNARSSAELDEMLGEIEAAVAGPYALNLVAHATNKRLEADLAVTVAHKVPFAIVSLASPRDIVSAVHN